MPSYDLGNLVADHPDHFPPALEAWIGCFAVRTSTFSGGVASLSVKTRPNTTAYRPPKATWAITVPPSVTAAVGVTVQTTFSAGQMSEKAALALAAAQIIAATGRRIREVGQFGDRGDYWLEDKLGTKLNEMVEIAGRQKGDVSSLYKEKRKQVRKNKGLSGSYTSVTVFDGLDGYFCKVG